MIIKITDKNSKLLTKDKVLRDNIDIALDDTSSENLVSENIKQGVTILGVEGSVKEGITPSGTLEITSNGEQDVTIYEKVNVNVESSGSDMLQAKVDATNSCAHLFYNYDGDNVDYISNLDVSKVTNIDYMFFKSQNLKEIPYFIFPNVTDMRYFAQYCYSLEKIKIGIPNKITEGRYAFADCDNLKEADLSYFYSANASSFGYLFLRCHSLKKVIIREFGPSYILNGSFGGCYHLDGTVDETYNPNGDKDGYIYVPKDMVETLKVATNWSVYADQLRALEDYTIDGTTTGDLDESKI